MLDRNRIEITYNIISYAINTKGQTLNSLVSGNCSVIVVLDIRGG